MACVCRASLKADIPPAASMSNTSCFLRCDASPRPRSLKVLLLYLPRGVVVAVGVVGAFFGSGVRKRSALLLVGAAGAAGVLGAGLLFVALAEFRVLTIFL